MNMDRDLIMTAMDRFEIPDDYEHFLFVMPAFYIAKADGKISAKETFSIVKDSILFNLVDTRTDEHEKDEFLAFAHNKILTFMGKSSLDDLSMIVNAITEKLEEYPEDERERIKARIMELCTRVAKSSGPLFKDKISSEEAAMLDTITKGI